MNEQDNRVVVIGGGYAGVMAANRLAGAGAHVTLVNPRAEFVERIRLHQLAIDNDDAVEDYATILNSSVHLVVDSADRIDASARRVELASGVTLTYDYLVYAVGSTGAVPAGVPGAAQFAYPISELEQAQPLRAALATTPADAPIVVVGAGPTGLEVATEFAEAGRNVTLACGGPLGPYLADNTRKAVAKRMRKLGVTVVDGPESLVIEVRADAVKLANGQWLASTVTVWTAGFGVPDLARRSGLDTDALGRLLTDETLTSVDNPYIVAAGDASAPSDTPLRMSCQAALPLGAQAANTVLSRIAGTEPATVNQAFTGQCISLGRTGGTIQLAHLDDRVMPMYISGRVAASIKEAVCRGTLSFLTREARTPGSYFWLKGGKRAQRLAAVSVK